MGLTRLRFQLFSLAMIIFLQILCGSVLAETRQGIVVWRMEAKEGVTEKNIDSISGFITAEVEKLSGMKAVSDADVKTILEGEARQQTCGVENTSCIAEIGNALGVPEAVSGDLGRMGDYWMLNMRRLNVRTALVISRVGKQIKGDTNALIEAIPGAVGELFGKIEETSPYPVVKKNTSGSSIYNKVAYGTFFPGLALVALGGIGTWQMAEAQDAAKKGNSGAKSDHSMWKSVSIAGYAVGGAAMATGAVMWILDAMDGKKAENSKNVEVGFGPGADGQGAFVVFQGEF